MSTEEPAVIPDAVPPANGDPMNVDASDIQPYQAPSDGTVVNDSTVETQNVDEKPSDPYASQDGTADMNSVQPSEEISDQTVSEVKMEPAPPTAYERLWNIVNINPSDFSTWTSLISETERLDDISKIRLVYDKFLSEFPLCYGYWKKYADHETRHGNSDKTVEVYERAVASVAYSVDMWTHYCVFTMGRTSDAEEVRSLFERGVSYVGTDYLAHVLWDKYLEFELAAEEWSKVAQLYTRILAIPLQHLDRYYTHFKAFVYTRPLIELWTPQETAAAAVSEANVQKIPVKEETVKEETVKEEDAVKEETVTEEAVSEAKAEAVAAVEASEGEVKEGEKTENEETTPMEEDAKQEVEPKQEDTEPNPAEAETPKPIKTDTERLEEYLLVREALYRASKEKDSKIKDYENLIKRPYFHVKPLDEVQLSNWHRYLDFIEKDGDFGKIVKLYERCVIPCANYSEYWIRYVERMVIDNSMERAMDALNRATTIFVKRRPEIHLFSAKFNEQLNEISSARSSFELISSEIAPGLLEAVFKFANFERRQGNIDAAIVVFESTIEIEKSKEESKSLPYLYIQYARFLDQVVKDSSKAREALTQATEKVTSSKSLWMSYLLFEASHPGDDRSTRVKDVLDRALTSVKSDGSYSLTLSEREDLSLSGAELIDLFGDIQTLKQVEMYHRQEFPSRRSLTASDTRKRSLVDASSMYIDRAAKQHKVQGAYAPAAAVSAQPPSAQAAWTGYAPQTYAPQPAWQPARTAAPAPAPAPVQQAWSTSAYSQQPTQYGAYSAYPATTTIAAAPTYSAYPTTSVPAAQAAAPAYSAYPQTYAATQAYQTSTQTGYAQTAQVPTGAAAAATQSYYQGYYAQ